MVLRANGSGVVLRIRLDFWQVIVSFPHAIAVCQWSALISVRMEADGKIPIKTVLL